MNHNNEIPIFITGTYRTGSTLLSRILNNHKDLNITYDSINYFRFVLKKNIQPELYRDIIEEISNRMKLRYGVCIEQEKIINKLESLNEQISHKLIYENVYNNLFQYNKKRWGEKSLMEWTNIETFLKMYPKGSVIHIVRDPRDVMASYKYMTTETGKKYLDSIFCCMSSMNQAIKYKNKLNKDNYRILKYEDLVGNKEICIREICEFLNIEFDSGMLDISKSIDIVHGKLDKNSHTSFPESKKLHGNWVHKLDQDEISIINTLLGDQMEFFSYKPTNKISSIDLESLANKLFSHEDLLLQRWTNFKLTNDGVEAYPSNPTKQKNWVKRSGISGEGASKEYIKFNS